MNRHQFEGGLRHVKGRAQTALGSISGDPQRQIRGAVNQVAGGAQYAYGRARDRAEHLAEDGRHLAHEFGDRAEHLLEDGRGYAREARRRGEEYGRSALRRAQDNRGATLVGLAALAFALGWFSRPTR